MNAPTTISRRRRATRTANFERLRAEGMDHIRAFSGQVWTDHNLHDPGITILEAACFALTELVYRADFDVADQLTGADGRIAFDALSLHPPKQALSCRATTAADMRRLLLDQVAGLDDAALLPAPPHQTRGSQGVYTLQLNLDNSGRRDPDAVAREALAVWRRQRPLGEDVAPAVVILEDRPCWIQAEIEIGGPRPAADILAELVDRAGRFIDRAARLQSQAERRAAGLAADSLYDGPLLAHGFATGQPRGGTESGRLYVADVAAQLRAVDGVRELRQLSLSGPEGTATAGALDWGGDGWVLALQPPSEAAADAAGTAPPPARTSLIRLTRRGHPVQVSRAEFMRSSEDLQARATAARSAHAESSEAGLVLPRGRYRPPSPYLPLEYHFPAIYGLGPHGVPPSAGRERQDLARQLGSYLRLFDQVIANGAAQLEHLQALFSAHHGSAQSRWWQILGDEGLPSLQGLLELTPPALQEQVYEPFDRSPGRKQRVLDHLLGLYGESWPQNTLRQFFGHLDAAEVDAMLLRLKVAYLQDIVVLGRDRAGGFDYGRESWGLAANCSTVVRRVGLLLGFADPCSRPLTKTLRSLHVTDALKRRVAARVAPPARRAAARSSAEADAARVDFSPWEPMPRPTLQLGAELAAQPALDLALVRSGVRRDRYRLAPLGGADSSAVALFLRGEESGEGDGESEGPVWRLGDWKNAALAGRYAAHLRAWLLQLDAAGEGLHLVEHVLLRPLTEPAPPRPASEDFHGLRLTALLPDWTVRSAQPGFRRLAEESLRLNCPAHLGLELRWLDFAAMAAFEDAYAPWLKLRREHCEGKASDADLDAAAARVLAQLGPPRRQAPAEPGGR